MAQRRMFCVSAAALLRCPRAEVVWAESLVNLSFTGSRLLCDY